MTHGILTALLHPIRPRSPRSEGEESSAPVSLLPAGALRINSTEIAMITRERIAQDLKE